MRETPASEASEKDVFAFFMLFSKNKKSAYEPYAHKTPLPYAFIIRRQAEMSIGFLKIDIIFILFPKIIFLRRRFLEEAAGKTGNEGRNRGAAHDSA